MKLSHSLIVTALLAISGVTQASVRKSALTVELVNLGRFIQLYNEQEGSYPHSWSEFEKVNPNIDKTFSILTPTKRMMLVSPPIEIPRRYSGGGIAVAITRDTYRPVSWRQWPIIGTTRKILKEPVYGVIVMHNGGVSRSEIPPDAMRSILVQEGLSLPEPSGLGAFAYEKEAMMQRSLGWAAIVGFSIWLIWRLSRRHTKQRSEQGVTPNACPASSSSRYDRYNLNPVFHPRPRSGVGGLDVRQ